MMNLFLSFFEISVQTSPVVLALLLLSPFLNRRYSSKWKYYIWIALSIRLLIPLNPELPLRQIVIKVPEEITSPVIAGTETAIPATLQTGQKFAEFTPLDFIAVIWSAVCLCCLFVHFFSYFHYRAQVVRKGTGVENGYILRQLLRLRKDLQIKTKITIVTYAGAASPMMIGFLRPILVLPDSEYSREELFFILKHELIHLKRHDVYFKLLFVITRAVHWFNPLIYVMQKEACVDMELSCDERIIQGTAYAVRKAYTESLLSTLHKQYKKTTALTTQFYGGKQIMKKRFENILTKTPKRNGLFILICAVAVTLAAGVMAGCSIMETNSAKTLTDQDLPVAEPEETETGESETADVSQPEESETAGAGQTDEALSENSREIKSIAENFAAAYFSGDTDTIQSYLTNPYEWDIEAYSGAGSVSDLTLKGLTGAVKEEVGSILTISMEFKDSDYEDMFLYLTMEFVKQEDGWKIQFYGLEG